MTLTTDPTDPRLGHGSNSTMVPQNEVYLVLSEEERARGFVRPVRQSYVHVGALGPRYPTRDLTPEEQASHGGGYVKYEEYPPEADPLIGRAWTQAQLDAVGKGCGTVTTMGLALAETYARDPRFYGATYCCGCSMHRPVAEFLWDGTQERVGS
jgi:hypothetical protein